MAGRGKVWELHLSRDKTGWRIFPIWLESAFARFVSPFCLLGWTHDAMNAFGDRTSEFAAVAQALRSKGLKPLKHRKENVYTARMETNRLAAEISKDTHATAQKLEVLTKRT